MGLHRGYSERVSPDKTRAEAERSRVKQSSYAAVTSTRSAALKVTDVSPEEYPAVISVLPEGSYHIYDYQFFFKNLQENVKHRVELYMEQAAAAEQAA